MTQDVYECFQTILKNRKAPKKEPMIGKYVGFLYLDKNGMPMVALHWQKYFDHIVKIQEDLQRTDNRRLRLTYADIPIVPIWR